MRGRQGTSMRVMMVLGLVATQIASMIPGVASADIGNGGGSTSSGGGQLQSQAHLLIMQPGSTLGPVTGPQAVTTIPAGSCPQGESVTGFSDLGTGPGSYIVPNLSPLGSVVVPVTFTFAGDTYQAHWTDPTGAAHSATGSGIQQAVLTPNGSAGPPITYEQYLATHTEVIAVPILDRGHIDPATGRCAGTRYGTEAQQCCEIFTGLYSPPVACTPATCAVPIFFPGTAAQVVLKSTDNLGLIHTLPAGTSPTYVHIPTCAYLETGLPETAAGRDSFSPPRSVTVADSRDSYTYTVIMQAHITPGAVDWNFGDGIRENASDGPGQENGTGAAPTGVPQYDEVTHHWDPAACAGVYHTYQSVAPARTITVAQGFTVTFTAYWNDSRGGFGSLAVPCDGQASCSVLVDSSVAPGWSLTKAVDQVQGIPYTI